MPNGAKRPRTFASLSPLLSLTCVVLLKEFLRGVGEFLRAILPSWVDTLTETAEEER
jgi:hypothetical protein